MNASPERSPTPSVAEALAREQWTCARCLHRNGSSSASCAQCGLPRVTRARRGETARKLAPALAVALVVVAGATALFVPQLRDEADSARRSEAIAQERLETEERRRLRLEMRPRHAVAPDRRPSEDALRYRARVVAFVEDEVTADARRRVASGAMKGPVSGTHCRVHPRTAVRERAERDPS